ALDTLASARHRRESYVGEWLPEPLVADFEEDPADRVTLDDSVAAALLVVLQSLSPAERTAFLLHDTFGMPFAEIAALVGRAPAARRRPPAPPPPPAATPPPGSRPRQHRARNRNGSSSPSASPAPPATSSSCSPSSTPMW